jgi:integrase
VKERPGCGKQVSELPSGYVDRLQPIVLTAINTGLRRGELFSLRWADIDFDSKVLTVRAAAAKSQRSRRVPLNVEAFEVLEKWHQGQNPKLTDLVFPGDEGQRLTNINISWRNLRKAAKLVGFRFHDLRHHFASRLVQRGVDLNTVRELMGHADLTMTLRYAHLAPDGLSAAVAKLA